MHGPANCHGAGNPSPVTAEKEAELYLDRRRHVKRKSG